MQKTFRCYQPNVLLYIINFYWLFGKQNMSYLMLLPRGKGFIETIFFAEGSEFLAMGFLFPIFLVCLSSSKVGCLTFIRGISYPLLFFVCLLLRLTSPVFIRGWRPSPFFILALARIICPCFS